MFDALLQKNIYYLEFIQNKTKGCLYHLDNILKNIIDRIKSVKEYKSIFQNKNIIPILKNQESCRILTIRDICNIDTVIFNSSNEVIQIENLKYRDNVRLILYLKSVWVSQENIGISLKVSQIQRLEPLLLYKSLFEDEQTNNFIKKPPPPPPPPPKLNKKKNLELKEGHDKRAFLLIQKEHDEKQNSEQTAIRTRPSLSDIIPSKNKLRKTNIL